MKAAQEAVLPTIYRRPSLDCLVQQNEEAQRDELFGQSSANKSGRVNIEERRRQRAAAQRSAASRIGEGLAGESLPPHLLRLGCPWLPGDCSGWHHCLNMCTPVHVQAHTSQSWLIFLVMNWEHHTLHQKCQSYETCKGVVRILQMGNSA